MGLNIKTDPKTGRMSTESDDGHEANIKAKLERTRRELRDMIAGNTQFHVDPQAAPVVKPKPVPVLTCYCAYTGSICKVCEGYGSGLWHPCFSEFDNA